MKRVYVIDSEYAGTKIGVSDAPCQRMRELYDRDDTGACSLYFQTEPRADAYTVEAITKSRLAARQIEGEWFDVAPPVAKIMVLLSIDAAEHGFIARQDGAAGRNARSRRRRRERGLIRLQVQIYAEDRDAVHEYAAILRAKRQMATQEHPQ